MRRMTKTAALLSAAALVLSACGGNDTESDTGSGEGGEGGSDIKVGLAYDVGGRGDQSFNDAAAKGLDQAVEEFGMEPQEAEAADGEPESAREERLRTFAENGFNLGYSSQSSFSRFFAINVGMAPSDYRRVAHVVHA